MVTILGKIFYPEDVDSLFLRNVGTDLPNYKSHIPDDRNVNIHFPNNDCTHFYLYLFLSVIQGAFNVFFVEKPRNILRNNYVHCFLLIFYLFAY